MDIVVFILAILYLCGKNVGTALAICAILEVILITLKTISKDW